MQRRDDSRESIGGAERVDQEWEDRNADRRRETWAGERAALSADLKRTREELPLPQRLARVLDQIRAVQSARAGSIERSRGGGDEQAVPKVPTTIDVEEHLAVIEARVRELEYEYDVYRGVSPARPRAQLAGFEKDKILRDEFTGVHARDVAEAAPYLGSERTIRRIRSTEGLDVRGLPRDPK